MDFAPLPLEDADDETRAFLAALARAFPHRAMLTVSEYMGATGSSRTMVIDAIKQRRLPAVVAPSTGKGQRISWRIPLTVHGRPPIPAPEKKAGKKAEAQAA